MRETPEQRSRTMQAVRSRNTKPEMLVRRALHSVGLRYRLHDRRLPGSPDLVFPGRRLVVFVHGCFWHQHPGCSAASRPKSNTDYWNKKLNKNVERDRLVKKRLEQEGWFTITIWECQVKDPEALNELASHIKAIPASNLPKNHS